MAAVVGLADVGRHDVALAGGKGANLGELVRAGLPVPRGFLVTTEAYATFVASNALVTTLAEPGAAPDTLRELVVAGIVPDEVRSDVLTAYAALGRPPVAVRSSATAEDLAGASFAGQQDTYLNVRGDDAVLDAVRRCWASLWTDRAVAYRATQGIQPGTVAMAVVVQEMVEADAAGVLFTANPADGRRQETVVAAAWGLGEAVVSGTVDTDQVVVRPPDGPVLSRTTAHKAVLTAYADQGTAEREVAADRRRAPVLDDAEAVALTRLGAQVERHFGVPQDIEWARRDGSFFLVQARPITALPPPEADPPTDWSVPEARSLYVRASIVEQLPDPLTPLFADLVRTSVPRSLQALFRELVGEDVVREGDVDLPTVNGYAYYRYGLSGMGRLLLHSGGAFRMLLTPGRGGTEDRWRSYAHPRYVETVREVEAQPLADRADRSLVDDVRRLLDAGTEYYTAVQTIIPLAAASEVVLTWFYDHLVRRPGDPPAPTLLLGFDSLPIRAEKSLWDLAVWSRGRPRLVEVLVTTRVDELVAGLSEDASASDAELAEWRRRFRAHLEAYGHLVYNLDFANAVPADDPAPVLEALRFTLRGDGPDPYARQRGLADRRERASLLALTQVGPARGWAFRRLLAWAQRAAPLREDALGDVGLAWPELRRVLHELGDRLLDDPLRPADVFWLREAELDALVGGRPEPALTEAALTAAIERRQEVWRARRRVTPPQILPERWWARRMFAQTMPAVTTEQTGDVLRGLAGSAGRVTATARVLAGPGDFAAFEPGEVLVAAITTPAWTSLFPRAAAVVTDIGGPLSHSSIVAREYGIPAVLGTGSATRRIRTGDVVTVDGDAGTVLLPGG